MDTGKSLDSEIRCNGLEGSESDYELMLEWLAALASTGRKPSTLDLYRYCATQFLDWAEERGVAVETLTKAQARSYIGHLLNERGFRPKGVESRWRALRAWWAYMIEDEIVTGPNPWRGANPKFTPELPMTASEDQINALVARAGARANTNRVRDTAIVLALVDTMARRGEIAALEARDVLLNDGLLHLRVSKSRARHVALSSRLARAMAAWMRRRPSKIQRAKRNGTHIEENLWLSSCPEALLRAVVKRHSRGALTCHSLRRAGVVAALDPDSGLSDAHVIAQAGWSRSSGAAMLLTYSAAAIEASTAEAMRRWKG